MKPYLTHFFLTLLAMVALLPACSEDEIIPATNGLIANAGADRAMEANGAIILDGSLSYDKNNKPFESEWMIASLPGGSHPELFEPNGLSIKFRTDLPGVYKVKLLLTQGDWAAEDELLITVSVENQPDPIALEIDAEINSDKILTDIFDDPTKPDYVVKSNVEVRAVLTIAPGVVIEFEENKGLQVVQGAIVARGTAAQGIIFKGKSGVAGYWKGIAIHSNSDLNEFEYVSILNGGGDLFPDTYNKSSLTLVGTPFSGAALKMHRSRIAHGVGYGLSVQGKSTLGTFSENVFENNTVAAAYIPAAQLHKLDELSIAIGNGFNGIATGGATGIGENVIWKKTLGGTYRVMSDLTIKTGVSIDPGVTFRMNPETQVSVTAGYLDATGTVSEPVRFTSFASGAYWKGLYVNTYNENNRLVFAEVSNAGEFTMASSPYKANIYIGNGTITIKNSVIKNGLGYGLVTLATQNVNQDVAEVNDFSNLQLGKMYPTVLNSPEVPTVTGTWVDEWTFNQGRGLISGGFYDQQGSVWFNGLESPWAMNDAGFGIQFNEDGTFTWNIAEQSPMTGCVSYSAEYITGTASIAADRITFNLQYWRSKFYNSCDVSQNVDTGVTPFELNLPYEIVKLYDVYSGESYWQLKFTNPDGTTFSFFRN